MTSLVKVYHSSRYKSIVKCTKYYIVFLENRVNCRRISRICYLQIENVSKIKRMMFVIIDKTNSMKL